jgi:predicted nucleic acid-binding protein
VLPLILATVNQSPVTQAILDAAGQLPEPTLRSLDAIHLATAEDLRSVLTRFIAYDKRLAEAASARGLPVVMPA